MSQSPDVRLVTETKLAAAIVAKADTASLATVATSGSYTDLSNTPTISTVSDATAAVKGVVQLAGDLAGTAAAPSVVKVAGTSVTGTAAAGQALVATGAATATWSATKTVDTSSTPQPPSVTPSPGTGANGVSASDHVHPLPTSTQLSAQLSAGGISLITPLWRTIDQGETTLPRLHADDSGSYGSTPASGTPHFTYFVALKTGSRTTIRFQTGGTAQATNTYSNVGLYSVNTSTGALTLLQSSTQKALSGTYATQSFTLTASVALSAGTVYAVGFLQVASTVGSALGNWFNGAFMGGTPLLARTSAGSQTALPSTVTPNGTSQFPIYYEVV